MVDLSTSQLTPSTSTLLKQTPSYSQKKRERRNKKKEFEMAQKERDRKQKEQAQVAVVENLTSGASLDTSQKKKKMQLQPKRIMLDDQGQEW